MMEGCFPNPRWFFLLALACGVAMAQTPPPAAAPGSISGVIRDGSGKPLPEIALVLVGSPKGRQTATTGDQGEFRFTGLPPAVYRLTAQGQWEVLGTKVIALDAGQELSTVDMVVSPSGTISGRVLDEKREPVAGFEVFLMASVYQSGVRTYEAQGATVPDKQGSYLLRGVRPGASYRVVARRRAGRSEAISKVSPDRDARAPEPSEAWFAGSSTAEGASPLVLFPGEQRGDVDIRVRRLAARCVEASLETAAGPAALEFQILDGAGIQLADGKAGTDGRLRYCRPERSEFRVVAFQSPGRDGAVPLFVSVAIPAGDADVRRVRLVAQPEITLRGVVVLDGEEPAAAATGTLSVGVSPLGRAPLGSEKATGLDQAKSAIPGSFALPATGDESLLSVRLANVPKGFYVKEVTCGGVRVDGNRLHLGSAAANAELRIAIGRDGGSMSVQVQDEQGKPMSDVWVVASPADAASEGEMSIALWGGVTNPSGAFVDGLKPGKYLVVATTTWLNLNTETVGRLWRARSKAKVVEIGPNADLHFTLPLTRTE